MNEERIEKEFYQKYPHIFPKPPICGFDVGEGWFPLLTRLCDKITDILNQSQLSKDDKEFCFDQIKEKFGTIRVYPGLVHESLFDAIYKAIDEAEKESAVTCEYCGEPGKIRSGGWIKVRCDACEAERVMLRRKL